MSRLFTWRAVTGNPKENRGRKWLPLLVVASAILIVAGFLRAGFVKTDGRAATTLLINIGSAFPSVDRLDSLQWGGIAQEAAGAFGDRNAMIGHTITFLLGLVSCALGYVVLRSIRDVAAAKESDGRRKTEDRPLKQVGGHLDHQADDKAAAPAFTLGEPTGSKDDYNPALRIEPREYELGIDPSEEQFTVARSSTLEPEWKL
jgi:hypothetical protein